MTHTINHGGTTYRTRWPARAFTWFVNIDLDNENRSVRSRDTTCPHCHNEGMVVLDGTNNGVACPMCSIGRVQNVTWRQPLRHDDRGKPLPMPLQPPSEWCWRPSDDLHQYSWNNGLGIDHTTHCPICRTGPAVPGSLCLSCQSRERLANPQTDEVPI